MWKRIQTTAKNKILPSIILKIFYFQVFKALDSTCSRLHLRFQNSCKEQTISSPHLLKDIGEGNLHYGPLHEIDRIIKSANSQ